MARMLRKSAFTIGLLTLLMAVPALGASINKSVRIGAGEESGGASSVNGSIAVGADAVVTGKLHTVNGSIRVDSGATIEDAGTVNGSISVEGNARAGNLKTVNGRVRVGEGTEVDGEVGAVNGGITIEKGATISADVGNVNGAIAIRGAAVGGNLTTVSGNIELADGAVVKGDVVVEKPHGWGWRDKKKPRITIGPGSRVDGTIRLEREVELYISASAEVGGVSGAMSLDDAVRFSGDHP